MTVKNGGKSAGATEEDFGLERMHKEYHRHGGPQCDAEAKRLEGEIASSHVKHDDQLKKARPDGSGTKRS